MRNSFKKLILFGLYVIFSGSVFSQNIAIKTKSESILILKDTSFVKHVTVILKKSDEAMMYPIFYDTELEKISDIELYTKKGNF